MTDQTIALDTLAHLLATERRQLVIRALEDQDPIRLTELADELHSDSPHWSSRKDTYTTLQRNHVPKLVEEGIVAYRDDERKITQGPRFEIALEGLDALAGVVDDGDQRIVPDGGREWIACDLCGAEYRSQAAALRCCDDRFEDDLDPDDRPAMSAVDEHGSPTILTDGGVDQDDEVEVCPECESSGFQTNVQSDYGARSAESQYLCRDCDTRFDEPDTRERQAVGGRRGLAGILEDDDTELATDGGWVKPSGTRGTCIVSDADADLPRHVDPCECASHDGVCRRCGNHITIGTERTEYGHAKGHRSSRLDEDCPHRPDAVNAGNKEIVTDGGQELAFEVTFSCENCGDEWTDQFPSRTVIDEDSRVQTFDKDCGHLGTEQCDCCNVEWCPTCELANYVTVDGREPLAGGEADD